MGHDERHYPCQSQKRENIKTENGYFRICSYCGHTFKEIKKVNTLQQELLDNSAKEGNNQQGGR